MHNTGSHQDVLLFKAIINRALIDAFSFKNPSEEMSFSSKKYHKRKSNKLNPNYVHGSIQYLSWDARQFLRKDNPLFCYYCELIDIDPEYLSDKIEKELNKFDNAIDF